MTPQQVDALYGAVSGQLRAQRPDVRSVDGHVLRKLAAVAAKALAAIKLPPVGSPELEIATALCLLGAGKPTPKIVSDVSRHWPAIAAPGTDTVQEELALDVVTAYGIGWNRPVPPAANVRWEGRWRNATTRLDWIFQECILNVISGLQRIGVNFFEEIPDRRFLAPRIAHLLTDPYAAAEPNGVLVACEGEATTMQYGKALLQVPHGSKCVFVVDGDLTVVQGKADRAFQMSSTGRGAVEVMTFVEAERMTHRVTKRVVALARIDQTNVTAPVLGIGPAGRPVVKPAWTVNLDPGGALRLVAGTEIRMSNCACGHYRCADMHRIASWNPAAIDPGFVTIVKSIAAHIAEQQTGADDAMVKGYWKMVRGFAEQFLNTGCSPRYLPLKAFLFAALSGWYGRVSMNTFAGSMLYSVLSSEGWDHA